MQVRFHQAIAIMAAGLLAAGTVKAASFELSDGGGSGRGLRLTYKWLDDYPGELLQDEPDYKSASPVYFALYLGNGLDRCITAVLDESGNDGYDTVYIDVNNNGDLTDDIVPEPEVTGGGRSTSIQLAPLALNVKYAGAERRELRVKISFRRWSYGAGRSSWSMRCSLDQHLAGTLDIGGRKIAAEIYDSGRGRLLANACFDDYGLDRLRLDLDGDGMLNTRQEDFPLSKVIVLDDKLWQLSVDSAGKRVVVKPCTFSSGTIKLTGSFAKDATISRGTMELASNRGYAFTCDMQASDGCRVPEALYRASKTSIELKDADGKTWSATLKLTQPLKVTSGRDTRLRIGGPLKIEPVFRGRERLGGAVEVSSTISGVGGEIYESVNPKGKRLAPSVKITDMDGIVVAQGKMEYG